MMEDDKRRGLYGKFLVVRADGSTGPGGKHEHCEYFVLDLFHDKYAFDALQAYARACRDEFPGLAADLLRRSVGERSDELSRQPARPSTCLLDGHPEHRCGGGCSAEHQAARPSESTLGSSDPVDHASDCAFRRRGYRCNCAVGDPEIPSSADRGPESAALLALAQRAVESCDARKDEDVDAWAQQLAADSVACGESEYGPTVTPADEERAREWWLGIEHTANETYDKRLIASLATLLTARAAEASATERTKVLRECELAVLITCDATTITLQKACQAIRALGKEKARP